MRPSHLTLLCAFGISGACTCLEPPPMAGLREKSLIAVHARVLANEFYGDPGSVVRKVTVAVIKDYSLYPGKLPDTLVFWTSIDSFLCGMNPPLDDEEILFGDTAWSPMESQMGPPANAYRTDLCAGNVSGPGLGAAVAELETAASIRVPRPAMSPARIPPRIRLGTGFLFLGRYGADGRCARDPDRPPRGR